MDLISAFKSELFRPLVTLLIPGAVASAPYFLLASHYLPDARKFWDQHPSTTVAIVVGCIVGVGLVLENWGSRLEILWDKVLNKKDSTHNSTWNTYLGLEMRDEFVGQRYLRTLLVRMKFELAMAPALVLGGAGFLWLNWVRPFWPLAAWILRVGPIALAGYFAFESYDSAKTMDSTRKIVVEAARSKKAGSVQTLS